MNKILLSILCFFTLQLTSKVFSQCLPCIDSPTATERMNAFNPKRIVLQGISTANFSFNGTQVDNLKAILMQFQRINSYDGIRIYFALSGDAPEHGFDAKTLYLVMVPTIQTMILDQNGIPISLDDENAGVIISNGTFTPASFCAAPYLREWISRYLNMAVPRIQEAYSAVPSFQETHSLWYSKRFIFSYVADGLGDDLLTYLGKHTITAASINFASWTFNTADPTMSPFAYKLSLVFKFTQSDTTASYFSFQKNDMINNVNKLDSSEKAKSLLRIKLFSDTYTDTGNPCPQKKCP